MVSPMLLLFGSAAVPAAAPAAQSVHSAVVEKRLNYLVGDWVIQGLDKAIYRQRCAWSNGRAFVVCSFQDERDKSSGQTIFGYSELQKRFTYYRYDSLGRSLYQLGFATGTYGIVFTDERQEREGVSRVQTTFNLLDDGLHYTQYRSVEGRPWERTGDILYVPAVQARPARTRR